MIFDTLHKNITSVIDNIDAIGVKAMVSKSKEIIALNLSQLEVGKRADDSLISPDYRSDVYAAYKERKGSKAPPGVPNLKDEEKFYKGWYTQEQQDGLYMDSSDSKSQALQDKYSGNSSLMGIAPSNNEAFADLVVPEIIKTITDDITRL